MRVAFGMPTRVLQHTGIANVEKGSWPCWVRAFWLGPWIAAPGMTRRAAVRVATVSSGTHASWRPVVGLPVGRSHHTASPALKPFACNGAWDLGRVVRLGSAVPRLRGEPKSGSTDACAFVRVPGGGRRDGRTTRWDPESGRAWRPSLAAACSERLARLPPGRAAAAPLPKRNPKGRGCSARCSAQTGSVAAGSAPVQRTGFNMADPVLTGWSPQVCTPWWQSVRAQKRLHDVSWLDAFHYHYPCHYHRRFQGRPHGHAAPGRLPGGAWPGPALGVAPRKRPGTPPLARAGVVLVPGGGPRTLGGGRRPAPRPWPGRVSFWRLGPEGFGTPGIGLRPYGLEPGLASAPPAPLR